ncbi:MAG: SAM-dependent methyltransferase [Jatrophihabitantaceae bacterium]
MTAIERIFLECERARIEGDLIARVSASDKEFHFQDWVRARLVACGLNHDDPGRNVYPDFRLVDYPEGIEVKGLEYPGREADYDSNSQVPTGVHNGRQVYYVFGRYPRGSAGQPEYPVLDLVMCHGSFLNADTDYSHENKSFRGFGSYGDVLVRDRKMYVVPTPFALTEGTTGLGTLIVPAEFQIQSDELVCVGEPVRVEVDEVVVSYEFNLQTNELVTHKAPNPNAGREHHFKAYRSAGPAARKQVRLRTSTSAVEPPASEDECVSDSLTEDYASGVLPSSSLETTFPAAMLSRVAATESWRKEVHRPATSTHKWWAKRLGTVFRGIITSAVSPTLEDAVRAYETGVDLTGLVLLDPFAGSGTTAVEALKLGATAVSLDINPVATLVQRQAVQEWEASDLLTAFKEVEGATRAEIDRVHRTEDQHTVLYYFWVATLQCPTCAARVHLFDIPIFAQHAYPKRFPRAQLVCPLCLDVQEGRSDFIEARCANGHPMTRSGPVQRSTMRCPAGHVTKIREALGDRPPAYELYATMVLEADGRKSYRAASQWDRDLYAECSALLRRQPAHMVMPEGTLASGNNTDQAIKWNFRRWRDFFNDRQLYSLSLLGSAIRDLDTSDSAREALSALFSGTLEFNNMFASFKGEGTGAVRHMFAHHILKPERTPLEAHPWGTPSSSGSFSTLFESRLMRALEYKQRPRDLVVSGTDVVRVVGVSQSINTSIATSWAELAGGRGRAYIATTNSARTDLPDSSVDLVVTDPPYMDNVHYAELADFFHAWLRQIRPYPGYPEGPTTRVVGEVQDADPAAFGAAIEAVWRECARTLKPGGLLAFTFHQARLAGWVELIRSLKHASFAVVAVQPVKGEMSTSIVKAGAKEPSNLDSVVVCRPWDAAGPQEESLDEFVTRSLEALIHLRAEGVDVGRGDVRSVIRGTALAHLARTEDDLDSRTEEVDLLADRAIEIVMAG